MIHWRGRDSSPARRSLLELGAANRDASHSSCGPRSLTIYRF
jgi:hypothetical protein